MTDIWMKIFNTKYNSTEDMIDKLQELTGKIKIKVYKNLSSYYDNMNIRMDEDTFPKIAQRISKLYHKVLLLMKFLQTKPLVKNMNNNHYDLYYTVIKNRDEIENVDNHYENGYISLNDVNIPNHYVGIKDREK